MNMLRKSYNRNKCLSNQSRFIPAGLSDYTLP